jgi:hypothetical protein
MGITLGGPEVKGTEGDMDYGMGSDIGDTSNTTEEAVVETGITVEETVVKEIMLLQYGKRQ